MIKIWYDKSLFRGYSGLTEAVLCAPFEDPKKFEEDNFEHNRFQKAVDTGSKYLEYSTLDDCDYVVIPYKWDNRSVSSNEIINIAKSKGKKVITLYNDDFTPTNYLSKEEGYMFTTTIQKSSRRENEFSFPAFTGDFYPQYGSKYNLSRSIGFCGGITHQIRLDIINDFLNNKILKFDPLIRRGFWAPEMSKDDARVEYFNHMERNTFILCVRGAGNFSYRLYESMMMGRIPVIIDTDQVLPFEDIIDYSEFAIRIDYGYLYSKTSGIQIEILSKIKDFTDEDIIQMQVKSRENWLEYMSPQGWIKNFSKELNETMVS